MVPLLKVTPLSPLVLLRFLVVSIFYEYEIVDGLVLQSLSLCYAKSKIVVVVNLSAWTDDPEETIGNRLGFYFNGSALDFCHKHSSLNERAWCDE